ncbi:hypothetical protein MHYP_G00121120 [Metynnis hypsauchen]
MAQIFKFFELRLCLVGKQTALALSAAVHDPSQEGLGNDLFQHIGNGWKHWAHRSWLIFNAATSCPSKFPLDMLLDA